MVFPLVIQSLTCASCWYLFIFSASLSWMKVNILNQNPCIPSCPGDFQFDIIFSVFLSSSMCISVLGPSSSPSSSLIISFIHSAFSLCVFRLPYFRPKMFDFFGVLLLVCFYVMSSQLLTEFSFIILECPFLSVFIFLLFVDISLISLLSPELSGLFSQVVLLFFSCSLLHSVPTYSRIFLFYHFGPFS